ncbi:MAG: nucleotide sugar dehydrogenase, partial [Anaerolineaceae bacterium]|nr:nucleotide sugar dehydrogenase [Anaerolineaceae bacterium]
MRIVVVGAGYVGLVTGTCLAEAGNFCSCVDKDRDKVHLLERGQVPFYEAGLAELMQRNVRAGRLVFAHTDHRAETLADRLADAEVAFIAVGTPSKADGEADLSALLDVADKIASAEKPPPLVVVKSTVPVGTCARLQQLFDDRTGGKVQVAANPEFLREGAAVRDFNYPDRIVIGTPDIQVAAVLKRLYAPFVRTLHPILVMSRESAEMTKYAANCLLAARISFMNEMANLSRALGASVSEVRTGIGFDERIGLRHLFPGIGYGGSCFPKDVRAMTHLGQAHGVEVRMLQATHEVNQRQKRQLAERLIEHFGGSCRGRTVAVWGVTFKPQTDDLRDAPALAIIDMLLEAGATVQAYDPLGLDRLREIYGDRLVYAPSNLAALDGADALVVATEWNEFRTLDFDELRSRMKAVVIFDGRNLYN